MKNIFTLLVKKITACIRTTTVANNPVVTCSAVPVNNNDKTRTNKNDAVRPFASFSFMEGNEEKNNKDQKEQVREKDESPITSSLQPPVHNQKSSSKSPKQKVYNQKSWVNDDMALCSAIMVDNKKNISVNDAKQPYALFSFLRIAFSQIIKTSFMKIFLPKSGVIAIALMMAFSINQLNAQTAIWSEDFSGYSNGQVTGTASGPAGTLWSTSNSTLSVNSSNQRLQGTNLGTARTWSTGPINISTYSSISVSMDIGEDGTQESDDNITCQYSFNGSSWTTLTNGSQSDDFTSITASVTGLSGTNLYLRVIIDNDGSGSGSETHWLDNVNIYACISGPVTLPYTEGFEAIGPTLSFTSDQSSINGLCNWSYDEVESSGRLQFNVASHSGTRAAALDAATNVSGTQTNYIILTLNLSNYTCSNDLALSFWHRESGTGSSGDESHPNDKVWIRGSSSDSWIEIYDLDLTSNETTWTHVTSLDIDNYLLANGQSPGTTFQVRFGQEDNASFNSDGRIFDDITIDGTPASSTVGGSTTGGTTPICYGSSTGIMTLNGYNGSIIKWQKQLNGGGYIDIVNTSTTYSEVPSSPGIWDYRAVVQAGGCAILNSTPVSITVNALPIVDPIGGGAISVCVGATTTAFTDATAGGSWSITDGSGSATIDGSGVVTGVSAGDVTVVYTYSDGTCSNTAEVSLTITDVPATPTISGQSTICTPNSSETYSISSVAGATDYTWSVPSGWTIESGQGTNSIDVSTGSFGENGTISVTVTNACGTGNPGTLNVIVSSVNDIGFNGNTAANELEICAGTTGTTIDGGNANSTPQYQWEVSTTNPTSGFSNASGSDNNQNYTIDNSYYNNPGTYYFRRISNSSGCNGTSDVVTLTVDVLPAIPGTPTSNSPQCSDAGVTITANGAAPIGETWYWQGTDANGTSTANDAAATYHAAVSGTYYIRSQNNTTLCWSDAAAVTVVVDDPLTTPGTINQPADECENTIGNIFSIAPVSGATSYTWSVTGTGWDITSGQGTTSATITIGSGTGTVTVTASNTCGTTAESTTGDITPSIIPATPGAISGSTNPCVNTSNVYSITSVSGATSYTWSVTGTGWSVSAGQGTTSVTILVGSGDGTISVTADNSCGSSAASSSGTITPNAKPATPGAISGPTPVCMNTAGLVYSIADVPNATSYTWTVPADWTITDGQRTTSITVTSGSSAGDITVVANNDCGSSGGSGTIDINPAIGTNNTGTITAGSFYTKTSGDITGTTNNPENRGFLKFPLSAIPANATITGTTVLTLTQKTTNSLTNYGYDIKQLLGVDPVSATGSSFYNAIGGYSSGTSYSRGTFPNNTGPYSFDLNTTANTDIENSLTSPGYISMGFARSGATIYTFYGYDAGANAPVLTVNYSIPPTSLAVAINDPAAPTGSSLQTFCSSDNPTVADLIATGGTIKWYITATGGSPLDDATALVDGSHYYASQTDLSGCEGTSRLDVAITINQAPETTGITICQGGSGELTSSTVCSGGGSQSTGVIDAGTGSNVNGPGTVSWSNPDNITTPGSPYATVDVAATGSTTTEYLEGINYGFSIPANATITGIQVSINRMNSSSGGGNGIRDVVVSLLKGGIITGDNKAITGSTWATSFTEANYGSSSNLWGDAWTPDDINSADFGIALSVLNNSTFSSRTATVDYMRVTVTYTLPGSIDWYTASSGGTAIGSGSPFNPVGVLNSGLDDTNIPGTYTFYAECASIPGCRTATDFVINPLAGELTATETSGVAADDNIICEGDNVDFTATSGFNNYDFKVDNVSVQNGASNTFSSATLTDAASITVDVTNSSNCTSTFGPVVITVNPIPAVIAPANQTYCNGEITSEILLSGTPSGVVYDISGGAAIGLSDQTGVTSIPSFTAIEGSATVTITASANGCTGSSVQFDITVRPTPVVTSIAITGDDPICSGTTSTIEFTGTPNTTITYEINGSGDYTIDLDGSGMATFTTDPLTTTSEYNIKSIAYTNGLGCSADITGQSVTIAVAELLVSLDNTDTEEHCEGENFTPGLITATVSGGIPYGPFPNDYFYQWQAYNYGSDMWEDIGGASDLSYQPPALNAAGTYTYRIEVYDQCHDFDHPLISVTKTIIIHALPVVTCPGDFAVCEDLAPFALTGGLPEGGIYSGDGITDNSFDPSVGIGDHLITYSYTDVNGCSNSCAFTITVNPIPNVDDIDDQVVCNNISTATVTFNGAVNGTTFNWTNDNASIGLAADGSGDILSFIATNTGTAQQVATITVTPVANGCTGTSKTFTITVNPSPNDVSSGFSGTPICAESDGVLTFDAANATFSTPYTIEYSPDGGTTIWSQDISSPAETSFNVQVNPTSTTTYTLISITNGNGCTRTSGFGDATAQIIVRPLPVISDAIKTTYNGSDLSCADASDGEITVTASGAAPLQYSKDNGSNYQSGNVFSDLSAGTYEIIVMDNNGCVSHITSVTIEAPAAITATAEKTLYNGSDLSCADATDGEITVTASGGTGTLVYSDDGVNYQSSNVFSDLEAGEYHIKVKDENGCVFDAGTITIEAPAAITATAEKTLYNGSDLSCADATDGEITVTASGGTGTLVYSNDDGATYQSSNVFSDLEAGEYHIKVKDDNGCVFDAGTITIEAPAAITATAEKTLYNGSDLSCADATDGEITVTANGGTGTLVYSNDDGATYQSSNVFSDLEAGEYHIKVKDDNGCVFDAGTITIEAPAAITGSIDDQTSVSCFEGNDGSLTVSAIGGTGIYQYRLDDGSYQNDATFSGLSTGSYIITIKDVNGCTTTVPVTIVYGDNAAPVINCPSNNFDRNTNTNLCSYQVDGAEFDVTATDDCPLTYTYTLSGATVSTGSNSLAGVTFELGTTHVHWEVSDGLNISNCEFDVTVTDDEAPVISCSADQSQSADAGVCNAVVTVTAPTTGDNCGVASVVNDYNGSSNASGTYPVGETIITWTVTDIHGHVNTCTQKITVTDDEVPTISCSADQTQTADAGVCNALVTVTPPTTGDNCGVASVVNDYNGTSDASDTYPVGETTITWTVTDIHGHVNTCTQKITVTDDEAPVISCSADQTQTADAGVCTAAIAVTGPTATNDNCGVASVVNDYNGTSDASDTYPVGETTITWTVTDIHGNTNTCTQKITVTDDEAPTISCSSDQAQTADAGVCTAAVTVTAPTTGDNCGVASVLNDYNNTSDASGTYPVGETIVKWTVTDIHGNINTCTQKITVTDDEAPTISCSADQTQTADAGVCNAAVTVIAPTTGDNCGVASVVNDYNGTSNASDTYPVGETTIIWTVTDIHGHTNTCTQKITVTDDEAPTVSCSSDQTQTADAGVCNAAVTVIAPTTGDNCGVASVVNDYNGTSNASGTYPVGETIVKWTVTDIHGNINTCEQKITVTDNEAPTISCAADQTQTADAGVCNALVIVIAPTTGDNCGVASVLNDYNNTSNASGTYPVGTTTVKWTVTDIHGNINTCTQKITVTDDEAPVISCPGTITVSSDDNQCVGTVALTTGATATDNCGVASIKYYLFGTEISFPRSFPVGETTVQAIATDIHGNTSECSFIVSVLPHAGPAIGPQNFCSTATVADLPNGGGSYRWYLSTSLTALSGNTALSSQVYYVSKVVGGCESSRTAVNVTVGNLLPPVVEPLSFCGSATVASLPDGGGAYKWYANASGGSALAGSTSISTGTYYVSQTGNTEGCESSRVGVNVTITAPPAAPIVGSQSFCGVATVASLPNGNGTYNWYGESSGGSILSGSAMLHSGTYYVSIGSAGCESSRAAVNVVVGGLSAPNVEPQSFCGSATVASLPNGGGTYKWYSLPFGGTALPSSTVLNNGVYYVSQAVAGLSGCESSRTSVSVSLSSLPSASISYAGSPYCNNGMAQVTLIGQAGGTYTSTTGLNINSVTGEINLAGSVPRTYTVTYSFANGSCRGTTTATVTIVAPITEAPDATEATVCQGNTQQLSYAAQGGVWSSTNTSIATVSSTGIVTGVTPGTVTINYTITTSCGVTIISKTVNVSTVTTANISYSRPSYCRFGGTAFVSLSGPAGGTYSSNDGLSINSVTGAVNLYESGPGSHAVTYTYTSGNCTNSTTASIKITNCYNYSPVFFFGGTNVDNTKAGASSQQGINPKTEAMEVQSKLEITAYPNPTENYFNLKVKTAQREEVTIRVYEMSGKLVHVDKGAPEQTYRFGDKFTSGTYIVEVTQNKQKVISRIVKQ